MSAASQLPLVPAATVQPGQSTERDAANAAALERARAKARDAHARVLAKRAAAAIDAGEQKP